jgi:hypothetical protein
VFGGEEGFFFCAFAIQALTPLAAASDPLPNASLLPPVALAGEGCFVGPIGTDAYLQDQNGRNTPLWLGDPGHDDFLSH